MGRKVVFAAIFTVLCLSSPPDAAPQSSTGAIAFFLDPSVRAAGMGRASTAMFWGGDPNYWANPALLGYHRGIRYEHGRTQLVPDLADDVFFTTRRATLGAFGIGISFAGKPNSWGESRLDYGESIVTDPGSADPVGTFHSFEEVESFAIGANLVQVVDSFYGLFGNREMYLHRYADVSLGWSVKTDSVNLVPPGLGDQGSAGVTTHDLGFLVRLTPYNSINQESFLPGLDAVTHPLFGGLRLEVAYGEGYQNFDNRSIALVDPFQADPVHEAHRRGWAARVAMGMPSALEETMEGNGAGWFSRLITPLVSFGKAWDRTQYSFPGPYLDFRSGEPVERVDYRSQVMEESGWELTLGNIYTVRRGRIDDPEGSIHGDTEGWGLGFRYGDIVGFRYDEATIPQYVELDRVKRISRTFYFSPLALYRSLHGADGEIESEAY